MTVADKSIRDEMKEEEEYVKYSIEKAMRELPKLKGWTMVEGPKLHREIEFDSFEDAISFMGRAALEVAKLDHHPEWYNVYNKVKIDLTTHDVNGLSNYDFRLARILDEIISKYKTQKKH